MSLGKQATMIPLADARKHQPLNFPLSIYVSSSNYTRIVQSAHGSSVCLKHNAPISNFVITLHVISSLAQVTGCSSHPADDSIEATYSMTHLRYLVDDCTKIILVVPQPDSLIIIRCIDKML